MKPILFHVEEALDNTKNAIEQIFAETDSNSSATNKSIDSETKRREITYATMPESRSEKNIGRKKPKWLIAVAAILLNILGDSGSTKQSPVAGTGVQDTPRSKPISSVEEQQELRLGSYLFQCPASWVMRTSDSLASYDLAGMEDEILDLFTEELKKQMVPEAGYQYQGQGGTLANDLKLKYIDFTWEVNAVNYTGKGYVFIDQEAQRVQMLLCTWLNVEKHDCSKTFENIMQSMTYQLTAEQIAA